MKINLFNEGITLITRIISKMFIDYIINVF